MGWISIKKDFKEELEKILAQMGLDIPTAARIFFTKVINTKSIPFQIESTTTENGLNKELEAQILKAEKEEEIGPFKSVDEALKYLNKFKKP